MAISLVLGAAFAVHADNTIAVDKITVNGSNLTVDFTTNLASDDQVTLITYKADSASAEATSSNIKYINQVDKGSSTSISYALNELPSGTYQVKMGGTDIAAADVLSITVDSGMSGNTYFVPNKNLGLYKYTPAADEKKIDQNGQIITLATGSNYLAAYAEAPARDGYSIIEYGVRFNGTDYSAEVALKNGKHAILFKGAITAGMGINIFPYVKYQNNSDATDIVTYYGNTTNDSF